MIGQRSIRPIPIRRRAIIIPGNEETMVIRYRETAAIAVKRNNIFILPYLSDAAPTRGSVSVPIKNGRVNMSPDISVESDLVSTRNTGRKLNTPCQVKAKTLEKAVARRTGLVKKAFFQPAYPEANLLPAGLVVLYSIRLEMMQEAARTRNAHLQERAKAMAMANIGAMIPAAEPAAD